MEESSSASAESKCPTTDVPLEEYPSGQSTWTSSENYSPSEDSAAQSKNEQKSNPYCAPAIAQTKQPYVPPTYGWWKDMLRNRPQFLSLAASSLIFISGGMSFAWSFDWETSFKDVSQAVVLHMKICWFVAVIIGASTAAIFFQKITMRVFNIQASLLVMVNGILVILMPENTTASTIAQYCNGIAFGSTLITAVVVGSEQAVKRFRGAVLIVEKGGLIAGIAIYLCFCTNNNSNLTHGFLTLIYGAVALVLTFIYTIESPISYLRKGNETGAIQILSHLQKPEVVTEETYALLHENKRLLEEDIARTSAISIYRVLMLSRFRILVMMSSSVQVIFAMVKTYPIDDSCMFYTLSGMRLVGIILAVYSLDIRGRKGVTRTSWLVGGGLLFGIGMSFKCYGNNREHVIYIAKGSLIVYQVLAGLTAPASTCYLAEAYPISVKPYFILVAVVLENIVQVIVCGAYYLLPLGILQMAFAIFTFSGFPETKQTTLREALGKFA